MVTRTAQNFYFGRGQNQLVSLWIKIHQVQLTDQQDSITWSISPNGSYSARSAYQIQFIGSFADFEWVELWKSKVEHKCKFFGWLILQNKLWTTDRITKHGGSTNTICQLCRTKQESVLHMLAKCSYSEGIWSGLAAWIGTDFRPPSRRCYRRLQSWWRNMLHRGAPSASERRDRAQKVIHTAWNLWKDR
jgi:hypothetical protein